MRRWCLLFLASSVLCDAGCGRESYAKRLDATLERMKRERRIEKNLMPAPSGDKRFTELSIYLRPPREEAATGKTGQLPVGEGQFDLDASFADPKADSKLHVLARVKHPKKPAAKGAPPPPPPAARGEFVRDVLAVLASEFGANEKFETPKFDSENKRGVQYKRLVAIANEKEVKLYTYKQDNYDVALIFVYDPKLRGTLTNRIDLCLETFAVGPKAGRIYNNGNLDDDDAGPVVPM